MSRKVSTGVIKALTEQHKKELSASKMLKLIFDYAQKITQERNLDNLLVLMADMGREIVVADRCTLWLLDQSKNELWTKVSHGVEKIRMKATSGLAGEAIEKGEPVLNNDPYKHTKFNSDIDKETGYETRSVLAIPLKNNDGETIGVFQALNKLTQDGKFTQEDIDHLTLAAAYSAKSIESSMLYQEIEETQKEIIETMGAIGENRSRETANHVKRVAEYSKLLALKCGLGMYKANLIKLASPMHDIGKVGIPDAILNKKGKLTEDEFNLMKRHTEFGYNLLKHSNREILKASAIIAHQHHEKYDGTGYPIGLKGEEIHIFGRITALADVFDALGSDRCYKKAWSLDEILREFDKQKGKQFDSKLVDVFIENLDDFLFIRDTYIDGENENLNDIIETISRFS